MYCVLLEHIREDNSLEATDHGREEEKRKRRGQEREAMRQLPPEITRINLDGPPSKNRPKPKTPKHDSSPNEIAR